MTTPGQPRVPAGPQLPPIIINNNVSSAASAAAVVGRGGWGGRRRQSFWVHFWLLLTAGIGNVLYAMHISRWNRAHGL